MSDSINDMNRHLKIISSMTLLMIVILILPNVFDLYAIKNYLLIHTVLEMMSIISASLIFAVGWNTYTSKLPANIIFISILFLSIAIFDVSHLLSYPEMPDYVTPSSPEKAINFWLVGRLTASLGLLIFVFSPLTPMKKSFNRYVLLVLTLIFTVFLHWVFLFHQDMLPRTFISGEGLTNFKIYTEYVIIGFHILTLFILYNKMKQPQNYPISALFTAVSIMIMGEFFFTLYNDVTDIYNLAGHLYKVIAYMYIYKVIFITSVRRPYEELDKSQAELINQNSMLDTIFKNLPNIVFFKDAKDLKYVRINTEGEKYFGLSNNDAIGKSDYDLFSKDEADFFTKKDRKSFETKQSINIPEESLDTPFGIRTLHTKKVPIFDENGQAKYLLGISEDITDSKKAEVKEKMLLDLIDSSSNEYYVVKKDTLQFTYANKGAINNLQYTLKEIQNMHSYDIVEDHTKAEVFKMHQSLLEGKTSQVLVEAVHTRKDGTNYPVEVYLYFLNTLNDNEEFLAVVFDITKRKENEKTIKDQEKMMIIQSRQAVMGEMISMIAHQWRQPLSSISAISGTLTLDVMMDKYKKDFFQEELESISQLSQHLSKTIDDFRDFFKEGKKEEVSEVKNIIDDSIAIIGQALINRNINLSVEYIDNPKIKSHINELKQVILNLLKNAEDILLEQDKKDANIWINVSTEGSQACITIEDNAGGVSEDIIEKIFDPYFSTKKAKDGTGLGLYMSKVIIEDHCKGSLKVENSNRGAKFTIIIPIKNEENNNE